MDTCWLFYLFNLFKEHPSFKGSAKIKPYLICASLCHKKDEENRPQTAHS